MPTAERPVTDFGDRLIMTSRYPLVPRLSPSSHGAAVLLSIGLLAGCSGGGPMGSLEVEPSTVELAYPTYEDVLLTWTPSQDMAPTEGRPTTFVHLLDEEGGILRTFDHRLPASWRAGRQISKRLRLYQSAVAEALEPGSYRLTAGLYQPEDGRRWPIETTGEEVSGEEYFIATVVVPEPAEAPSFEYVGEWLEPESGTDRQVLARRWLTGKGSITVESLPGPGVVWMVLHIPELNVEGARLVVEEGARVPAVRVFSPTVGSITQVQGAGEHHFSVPVPAEHVGGPVEIQIEPNFYLILESTFERRTLTLEKLAFRGE